MRTLSIMHIDKVKINVTVRIAGIYYVGVVGDNEGQG